jgi:two-component system sensor histidine kinase YesM
MLMHMRARQWALKSVYFFGNVSLQTKLIFSYVLIILVPMILISMYMFNDFYQNTIKDVIKTNQYMLEVENNNINNNMEIMERTAQLSVSDTDVNNYLLSSSELDVDALLDFYRNGYTNLIRLQFNNPNISNIRLYSSNPNIKEMWPVFLDESRVFKMPWYKEVLARKGTVYWEFQPNNKDMLERNANDHNETDDRVSLYREIAYPANHHVGIIEVNMLLEHFFPKTYGKIQDGQSQMLVVDRAGAIYTNKDAPFFKNINMPELIRQFETNRASSTTSFQFADEGVPYLCVYAKLERLDAVVLNVVSLDKPLKDIRNTRNNIILANVVLIALLSLITFVLQSLILKKLHVLQDSMKKIRQGNFNFDIKIRGGGEVGELAFHFRMMLKKINGLIADAVNKQAATKEAELNSLKNQIDSHFLYNTLENFKMMAEIEGQYALSDALTSLGGMMRYSMKWTNHYVRLSEEIGHIRNYIAVMNIRYNGILQLNLDIPPEYSDREVLKMSLQPIVENAVKHGVQTEMSQPEYMIIAVKAYAENDRMIIEVTDNGSGMTQGKVTRINEKIMMDDTEYQQAHQDPGEREEKGTGIGLRNVNQRVILHYGKDYGVRVASMAGAYTKVTITLPFYS